MKVGYAIGDEGDEGGDDECDGDVAEEGVGGDAGYVATEFASYDSGGSCCRAYDANHDSLSYDLVEWSNEKIYSNSPNDFDSEKIEM